jgi:hypothetical protein
MDLVRKLVSGRLLRQASGPHPDADLLSAFSENALPEAERQQVVAHVAECPDCRETLFLSLPQAPDAQKVLVPQASRWHFAMRWGALAASVIVIASVFAVRHELRRGPAQSAKVRPATEGYVNTKIAEEKVPAEVENMRLAPSEKKTEPAPTRERPDLKHMTAKMQRTLTFGKSDEVQVSPPASSNLMVESRAMQDLPVQSRKEADFNDLAAIPPGAASASSPANAKDKNAVGLISAGMPASAGRANLKPHLAGTVFDVSGAVVPNAKVTTVGPIGTETVTSDTQGKFFFDSLAPGLYSVKAEASGFKPLEMKQVTIASNQSPPLELKLAPGASMETVEVYGAMPAVASPAVVMEKANTARAAQRSRAQNGLHKATATGAAVGSILPMQWTLSPQGAVQSSSDGGKTWQVAAIAPNTTFRALSAVGSSIWVGGSGGSLYHSLDGGQNWTPILPAANGQKLQSDVTRIEFLDSSSGTVSTNNGERWITHDGGSSWERQ